MKKIIIALLLVNLVCLYLILDIASYDELTAYLSNGVKHGNPLKPAVVLMFSVVANILFLLYSILKKDEVAK